MPVSDTQDYLAENGFFQKYTHVLDLGCSDGFFASEIRQRGFKYVGIDIQKKRIAHACLRFHERRDSFRFIHRDIKNQFYNPNGKVDPMEMTLPFEDNSFDNIVCHSLFTHLSPLEATKRYISEIRRVARPGCLLWTTWFKSPPNKPTNDEARTVYSERDIRKNLEDFTLLRERGGKSNGYHDQWEMIHRKPL